jgi:hypothetical protein
MLQFRYAKINGKNRAERMRLMRDTTIEYLYVISGKIFCAELADGHSYCLDRLQKLK